MPNNDKSKEIDALLKERFAQLPEVVRNAITSADVEKQLRTLADGHNLHIDQWSKLENEVMVTLLGLEDINSLQANIEKQVGVTTEEATSLAADISKIVFEPIRQELERQLEHPAAQEKEVSAEDMARNQILAENAAQTATPSGEIIAPTDALPVEAHTESALASSPATAPTAPTASGVLPATPPPAPPTEKAVRAPISSAYSARQPSSERKIIEGDPYREPPK